ncbi:MAG: hypothetical protein IJ659_09510 [Alloprevotella sp.]|nr:hypothetical protein [Alloprevotella sp.]MBR1594991.1 hypothetical protein [Alloprevotella sp.]
MPCSLTTFCDLPCDDELLAAEPEYYDDEELDRYRGRPADLYGDAEVMEFEEVLTTMRPDEVHGWLRSLSQRGIELPASLRDMAFMLIEEAASGEGNTIK